MAALIVIFNFFMPTFNNKLGGDTGAGNLGAIVINAGMFVLLVLYFVFCNGLNIRNKLFYLIVLLFMAWLIVILFSILLSKEIVPRDIFEIHRPFLYFLTCLFGVHLSCWSKAQRVKLFKFVFFILTILSVISILQYFGYLQEFTALYSKRVNVISGRGVGTFVNPYDLSFVLILPVIFSLIYIYTNNFISIYLVCIIICILGLLATQSKTGLIVVLFSLFLALLSGLILNVKRKNNISYIRVLISFVFITILCYSIVYYLDVDYLMRNFSYLFVGLSEFASGDNNSFNIRMLQVSSVLDSKNTVMEVIFGNGVQKGNMDIIENEYLLYYYRYGVVGVIILFITLLSPIASSLYVLKNNVLKSNDKDWEFIFIISCFIWCIVTLVALITNAYIDIIRTQFLYYTIVGYLVSMAFKEKAI